MKRDGVSTLYKDFIEIPCYSGTILKIAVKNLIYSAKSEYQEIRIYDTELYGKCLFLDGVIQCSENDHEEYDKGLLKKLRREYKSILILGGGDGYTAEMALKINPEIKVIIVELDQDVIKACEMYLHQNIFNDSNVIIVNSDAFKFIRQRRNVKYDGVICDVTDLPVGYDYSNLRDFYWKIFSNMTKILSQSGWISAYVGCNEEIANDIMHNPYLSNPEKNKVFIPSFGESCFFIHGTIRK